MMSLEMFLEPSLPNYLLLDPPISNPKQYLKSTLMNLTTKVTLVVMMAVFSSSLIEPSSADYS